jgi:hypothetical protein
MYLDRIAALCVVRRETRQLSANYEGEVMLTFGKGTAFAVAAVAAVGLSAGSAAAHPVAGSSAPHAAIHGTGGLRPDIRLPRNGRAAMSPAGLPIQYSGNWSGYIALPKSGVKTTSFRYVQADYSVPNVNCGVTPYAFSYQWVGLDGDTDGTVEQDGISGYCVSGSPTYFAWSEMFPAGVAVQFYLNPGDAINSSVFYNSSTHVYTLALTDLTSGQTFSTNATCAATCNNSSAEVITEGYPSAPYNGTSDFGMEHYDNATITGNTGVRGALTNANWNTDESIATGTSGTDTAPGALYTTTAPATPAMSAFDDQWFNQN